MSATIFVRNLPFDVTQEALETAFGDIGPIKKVDVIKDKGRSKAEATTRGFAFVRFAMAADAQYAIDRLNNSDFGGRRMIIEIAKEKGQRKQEKMPAAARPAAVEKVDAQTQEEGAEDEDHARAEKTEKTEKKTKKEKKAKKEKKEVEEEVEEADEVEVEEKKPKKEKKEKKAKKEKKVQEEAAVEEEEEAAVEKTKAKKDKKKAKAAAPAQDEEQEDVEMEDATPAPAQEETDAIKYHTKENHVQSERNARRRQHRELLRQVEARKEASASAEEKSVLVYGLGHEVTQKVLYKKVKKIATVTKVELKEEPTTGKKYAVVEFTKAKDAQLGVQKLDSHIFKGATLKAVLMAEAMKDGKASEGLRLIIRNLSFQATDADLEKLFGECGEIAEAKVVRLAVEDPDKAPEGAVGKSRGFAFVQFRDGQDARKAIEKLNGFKLKGREMIVDFALAKAKYLQQQKQIDEAAVQEQDGGEKDANDNEDDEEDDEQEEDGELDHGSAEMEEDDDNDAEDGDVEVDAEDDTDDEEEEEEDDDDDEEDRARAKKYKEDSEEQRMRTIFIRNLSFQTTEEAMKEFFATFGAVEYARVVVDKGSGLSKGVGFVRFKQLDAAETVLARGQIGTDQQQEDKRKHFKNKKKQENLFTLSALADGDALMLDGRMLIVSRTVAKDDAARLAEANSADRKKKDKRNMYLAYEGTINVNKIADEELALPKMDIEKRQRAIKEKKEKLKNPLYFVSPTRLSVRNIGVAVDDKQLKQLFHDAAAAGVKQSKVALKEIKVDFLPPRNVSLDALPVKVKMAKIVRDMESAKPGKEPRSRGFGFVEFEQHIHALAALRVLNNNPQYASSAAGAKAKKGGKPLNESEKSRLIVEFALENHGKLKLREKKQNDAVKKREEERALKEAQGGDGKDDAKSKKSRGQRQREKKKAGETEEEDAKATDKKAKQPKAAATKPTKPEPRQQKKRQREDDAMDQSLPLGSTKDGGAKPLSRKQRKQQSEVQQERSFDALVRNYKKEIFGDKAGDRKGEASGSGAGVGGVEAAKDRWFD